MRTLIAITLFTTAMHTGAQEANVTLQSTVSGSQEQPRVMYIVPWQQPGAAEFDFALHNGIAEEMFTPLDRDEFLRGLAWREQRLEAAAATKTSNQD